MLQMCLVLIISLFFSSCRLREDVNGSFPLERLTLLSRPLNETSGLAIASDSTLYTHNDSGHPPVLFQISRFSGKIIESFRISGVKNIDWEELASDEDFIYVGDFGNNGGTRKDLIIYKINKSLLPGIQKEKVETIRFYYPEQSYFGPSYRHNFDCEAMIALGDSLYLFTKNRKDQATDIYRLTKSAGTYPALHVGHFNTGGLVTAADLLPGNQHILALLGYEMTGTRFKSFIWLCSGFQQADFFGGRNVRIELASDLQAEALVFTSDTSLLITNEQEMGSAGSLFKLDPSFLRQ